LALDAVAVFVTYSRIPPHELYHVSNDGLAGGFSRLLVQLNWPTALIAIAIVGVLLERGAPLVPSVVAIVLCALTAFVVHQSDLDAKVVNVLPALGVAIAVALTIRARPLLRLAPRQPWDPLRIGVAAFVVVAGIEWVFAELGFYAGWPFYTSEVPPGEHLAAVHYGHHHGLDGVLFVLSALLLSRVAQAAALRAYVALMFVYGFANALQDFWGEQLVKRGTIDTKLPSMLLPSFSVEWGLILAGAAALYFLMPRPRSPSARLSSLRPPQPSS
jgi:hypothetical protein